MNIRRPRWQKVLADLWSNRSRSITVIASIAVGLFAIGVIATNYFIIEEDMRAGYVAVNAANLYVQSGLIDQEMVDAVGRMEGVRQVEGVRVAGLRALGKKGSFESIDLKAQDWDKNDINRLRLVEGVFPPGDGEIVLEQYKMENLGARLGDEVLIERPSGKLRSLKVVGVVKDMTLGAFSGLAGFFQAPVTGYVDHDVMDLLEQPRHDLYNGMYITVTGDGGDMGFIHQLGTEVTDRLEENGVVVVSVTPLASDEHPNAYLVEAIVGVLFMLGLMVVFLSGFLITNTLQALLHQQVQQIGIMKTVGARRTQIAGVYVVLIFVYGLLAFAVAAPLSHQLSYLLLNEVAVQLNFVVMGERPIPQVFAMQALLALVMPQLAAWLPIWKGSRISVQEALSGIQQAAGHRHHAHGQPLPKPRRRRSRFLPRPLLISLRNTFRRKGRLALTLLTLTLGGAVFIGTFNVRVSLDKYLEQIGSYFLADVNVVLERPYRVSRVAEVIGQTPGVSLVEGWASARSEMVEEEGTVGESVFLQAPPPGSRLIEPIMMEGRWIKEGEGNAIALNDQFAKAYPNLDVGETIELKVNGEDTEFVVVGFFQLAGKNGGFSAYASYDYLTNLIGQPGQAIAYRVVGDRPGMSAAEQDALAKRLEEHLEAEGIQVSDLRTGAYLTEIAGGGLAVLTAILLFLSILTALVGSIGLAGTMSMNVMERTREIGVMRAVGASDFVLLRMVMVEGMLIGAISYALGAALSFPISTVLSNIITFAIFEAPSNFGFTSTGFVIWLVLVILLSFLASFVPAHSATRLTIREVLAYE